MTASVVISDPSREIRKKIHSIAEIMARNAKKNGMVIKFRQVDVVSTALNLLEQQLKEAEK